VESEGRDGLNIPITCVPERGHLNLKLYLTERLAARGHRVTLAVGDERGAEKKLHNLVTSHSGSLHYLETAVNKNTQELACNITPSTSNFFLHIRDNIMQYSIELLQIKFECVIVFW